MDADTPEIVEAVARAIADGLGDNFDHAHLHKSHWIAERGDKGGRFRDVNEPFQCDYEEAARAAIAAARPFILEEAAKVCDEWSELSPHNSRAQAIRSLSLKMGRG